MNKLLLAAFVLVAVFSIRGQAPTPSFLSTPEVSATAPGTSPLPPPSKVDPEKEKLIRQLLARTREAELAQERLLQAMAAMKVAMPRVAEKFWNRYRQLISIDELRDRFVSVYDKHYTSEELNELLKFYDSPIGKKMSEEAVPISRESMEIAKDLSRRAAQSIVSDYQAEQLLQHPRRAGSLKSPVLAPRNPPVSPAPSPTATPTAP